MVAHDPGRAMELEGEVRRLAQVIDEMQGRNRAPSWTIIMDGESLLSANIMSVVIPRDFYFSNLKYVGKTDPLV